jgi:phosphate/sulfate permease
MVLLLTYHHVITHVIIIRCAVFHLTPLALLEAPTPRIDDDTTNRAKGVKWNTAQRMIITWVITLPISALLAALIFWVVHNPEYQCC